MAKKNTTPTASTKAHVGTERVTGSGASLCNTDAAAQQNQPMTLKSPSCSGKQSTSAAAVPGSIASIMTSPAWIYMVYLCKHTGCSILPFIRCSLCLAHPQLPPATLPPASCRTVSTFPSSCAPCQALFPPWIKSPPLLPVLITTAHTHSRS